ncbi:MAG: PfkB family carbohydrate kinase [Zunongwangia sp.]|uniref:PfkB family carbohydrate kinase n=1 Tax=Zunongwangia sp. TaxID=1965325 RepID=UPI003241C887
MIIIGGTYSEICFEPIWENIYGSGFRAVNLLIDNGYSREIDYYTCADSEIKAHLQYYKKLNVNVNFHIKEIKKSPEFHYDHPLKTPRIIPRPDVYCTNKEELSIEGTNVLAYGLIEALINIKANDVVYDPQSPVNPISFSATGSTADRLITIVNLGEAEKLSGKTDIRDIKEYFFDYEKCFALIIKMGAKGAYLFESINDSPIKIPVFQTNKVWPIGSGDVFSAFFAKNWFSGTNLEDSAVLASKATAIYSNTKDLSLKERLDSFSFNSLLIDKEPVGQIYLAGPFFTFSERWLVNEVWNTFKSMGLKIFSPFHDVGHGQAKDVVSKDLEGLDKSEIVFAIIDGLDSGTLFEVGYAICKKKKVIAFVQNEGEESLKMLEGTNCIIERDLTTAIYKLYWELAKE